MIHHQDAQLNVIQTKIVKLERVIKNFVRKVIVIMLVMVVEMMKIVNLV